MPDLNDPMGYYATLGLGSDASSDLALLRLLPLVVFEGRVEKLAFGARLVALIRVAIRGVLLALVREWNGRLYKPPLVRTW